MKQPISILALAGLFTMTSPTWAQTVAPVTAVTLYPGGATVVRAARIEAGTSRLVIPEVTTQFALDSLHVEADAGIRVGEVVAQDVARTESVNPAQAALEARIQALKDQVAALDVQAGAADIVKAYLARVGGDGGDESRRSTTDARNITATVAALSQAASDALGRKHQVGLQKREIEKSIAALQRDLERVRSQTGDSRTLTINLAAERAGTVRVSYQLNSAGWRPAYRAELKSDTSVLLIDRMAQVSQKTGEDWRGVRLSLSTTQPRQSVAAPTPQPWLLGYAPPVQITQAVRPPSPAAPMAAPAMAAATARNREADYRPPTFQVDGAFATEFVASAPVTIPADGRELLLPLARETLAAKHRLQVSPRLSTAAMVMAEAPRPAGVWPPGALQLYRDGSFVGATHWSPEAGQQWRLSFGRDDLLQVQLTPLQSDSGQTGLFDQRNQRRISHRVTLRNGHTKAVDVLVLEATPVSTVDVVKVEASYKPFPSIQSWEDRRGVVGWVKTLAPQATETIESAYTIEHPKDGALTGLR